MLALQSSRQVVIQVLSAEGGCARLTRIACERRAVRTAEEAARDRDRTKVRQVVVKSSSPEPSCEPEGTQRTARCELVIT